MLTRKDKHIQRINSKVRMLKVKWIMRLKMRMMMKNKLRRMKVENHLRVVKIIVRPVRKRMRCRNRVVV
jgi:hypothetical protein